MYNDHSYDNTKGGLNSMSDIIAMTIVLLTFSLMIVTGNDYFSICMVAVLPVLASLDAHPGMERFMTDYDE